VWTIGQNGTLYGLSPATGTVRQQASIGAVANHFPTPSVGDGLLLAPSARHVVAFNASSSRFATPATPVTTPATPASPATHPSSHSPAHDGADIGPGAIAGGVLGGLAVISGGGWILWRRRITGHN